MVSSIFGQLASFFFLFAAIFTDILLIRFVLIMGNLFLLINGSLGLPKWPNVYALPPPVVDVIVWSGLALVLHLVAFTSLLLDERSVKRFPEENCEALFQFFRRRSGICRSDFVRIINRAKWLKIPQQGTVVPTDKRFQLVVDGVVDAQVVGLRRRHEDAYEGRKEVLHVKLHSGNFFDMSYANIFHVPVGFLNTAYQATTACNDVLICSWDVDDLKKFAKGPPAISQSWKNLVAFCLADIAHRPLVPEPTYVRDPDFDIPPITKTPMSQKVKAFLAWMLHSMNPCPPQGIRHRPVPVLMINPRGTSNVQPA